MNDGRNSLDEETKKKLAEEIWKRQFKQIRDIGDNFRKMKTGENMVASISSENNGPIAFVITAKSAPAPYFTGIPTVYKLYRVVEGNKLEFTNRKSTDPLILEGLALDPTFDSSYRKKKFDHDGG